MLLRLGGGHTVLHAHGEAPPPLTGLSEIIRITSETSHRVVRKYYRAKYSIEKINKSPAFAGPFGSFIFLRARSKSSLFPD